MPDSAWGSRPPTILPNISCDNPRLKNHLQPPTLTVCIDGHHCPGSGGGGGSDAPLLRIIPLLSPEHRKILEVLTQELAKLEGLEIPAGEADEATRDLREYLNAWQNSLTTRGFSPGSIALYTRNIKHLLDSLKSATRLGIEQYLATRKSEGISATTLNNDLKAAKSFFAFLFEAGLIPADPTLKLHHPRIIKKQKVCPSEEEVSNFLAALAADNTPRAKVMIYLFINTGIRFSELATLHWREVDLKQKEVTVLGKGSKVRTVPIAGWLADFLRELRDGHQDGELVIPSQAKTGKWGNNDANRMIARICRSAGINKYSCHQFRHYFATYTLQHGGDLKSLQEMLGHVNASTTLDSYVHTDEQQIKKTHDASSPLSEIPREEGKEKTDGR